MKSVGEAMGIGRTFTEAFLKAPLARDRRRVAPRICTPGSIGSSSVRDMLERVRSDDLVEPDWLPSSASGSQSVPTSRGV